MRRTLLNAIIASFNDPTKPKQPKPPKTVWRAKVCGEYVTTCSGKTVWKQLGHAKNAIIHHLEANMHHDWCDHETYFGLNTKSEDLKVGDYHMRGSRLLKDLMDLGVVEFVEIDVHDL